jgi:hypothetical protein
MKKQKLVALELPLEQRALLALRSAVRKALAERKRAGLTSYIWANGVVAEIPGSPNASKQTRTRSRTA